MNSTIYSRKHWALTFSTIFSTTRIAFDSSMICDLTASVCIDREETRREDVFRLDDQILSRERSWHTRRVLWLLNEDHIDHEINCKETPLIEISKVLKDNHDTFMQMRFGESKENVYVVKASDYQVDLLN